MTCEIETGNSSSYCGGVNDSEKTVNVGYTEALMNATFTISNGVSILFVHLFHTRCYLNASMLHHNICFLI